MPFLVIREIWHVSRFSPGERSQSRQTPSMIAAYWICYVMADATQGVYVLLRRIPDFVPMATRFYVISWATWIVAGILCIRIVSRITENLEKQREESK